MSGTLTTTPGAWLGPEIAQLSEFIWQSTLGLAVSPLEAFPADRITEPTMDGFVHITGEWRGAVAVQVPVSLAARVAAIMFSLADQAPTIEDMQDALGEIANQTGGNVKALVGGTCHLSLPAVVRGADYAIRLPGTDVVTRVVLGCEDSAFVVSLLAASR